MQHAHRTWIQHSTPVSDNKHQLHNLSNKLPSEDAKTVTEQDIDLDVKYFSKQQDYVYALSIVNIVLCLQC